MPLLELVEGQRVVGQITPGQIVVGKVRGFATVEQPLIGRTVILEIIHTTGIDRETYPYSCMVVFENQIHIFED